MTMKSYTLWTAVVTPMMDNGAVDFESLTKVCRQQMEAKNGLLILGSTGEALNLSLATRKKIVEEENDQKHIFQFFLHFNSFR